MHGRCATVHLNTYFYAFYYILISYLMIKQKCTLLLYAIIISSYACKQPEPQNTGTTTHDTVAGALPVTAGAVTLPASTDSATTSPLRKKQLLQLNTTYSDTLTYVGFDANGDDFLFAVAQNQDTVALIYNETAESPALEAGDQVAITWTMKPYTPAGDPETTYPREFLTAYHKLKGSNTDTTVIQPQ